MKLLKLSLIALAALGSFAINSAQAHEKTLSGEIQAENNDHVDTTTAYRKGFQNADIYWGFSGGVTITSADDIKLTAETRAYRNEMHGRDYDAFVRGFCDETERLLRRQR